MATSQQLPRTAQPPPDLPNMPDVSTTLSGYLRNFSLWSRHGFASKLDAQSANPGILIQAHDAPAGSVPKVFLLQVTTAGAVVLTPASLGTGKP